MTLLVRPRVKNHFLEPTPPFPVLYDPSHMRELRWANHSRSIMLENPGLHIAVKSAVMFVQEFIAQVCYKRQEFIVLILSSNSVQQIMHIST